MSYFLRRPEDDQVSLERQFLGVRWVAVATIGAVWLAFGDRALLTRVVIPLLVLAVACQLVLPFVYARLPIAAVGLIVSLLDTGFVTAYLFLADATNEGYLLYIAIIVATAGRFGLWASIIHCVAILILYNAALWHYLGPAEMSLLAPQLIPRSAYIIVTALTAGWLAEHLHQQRRVHQLAAVESARLREEAERSATIDPLSQLYNRCHFYEQLEVEFARAARFEHPLSLLFLDVDNLKAINDRYGHPVGDRVIAGIGSTIKSSIRQVDTPHRIGGDEFLLILPETSGSQALVLARRLRDEINRKSHDWLPDGTMDIEVSQGISSRRMADTTSALDLFHQADEAMYRAKRLGQNGIACWDGGALEESPKARPPLTD